MIRILHYEKKPNHCILTRLFHRALLFLDLEFYLSTPTPHLWLFNRGEFLGCRCRYSIENGSPSSPTKPLGNVDENESLQSPTGRCWALWANQTAPSCTHRACLEVDHSSGSPLACGSVPTAHLSEGPLPVRHRRQNAELQVGATDMFVSKANSIRGWED